MAGLEKTDENWLRDECKRRDGRALKQTFLVGIPDRMVLLPPGRCGFIETKTPVGSLSPMQVWWQNKLRKMGFKCECIHERDGLQQFLDDLQT